MAKKCLSFFDLPREIFHLALTFLPPKDLGRLDLAVTDHHLRPIYLSFVDGMTIMNSWLCCNEENSDKYSYLGWLLIRKIIPLEISANGFHPLMLLLIMNSKAHLKTLTFCHDSVIPEIYFRQFPSCPSLETFCLIECGDLSFESIDQFFQLNPQLKTLELLLPSLLTPQIITSITRNCPNVTSLDLSECLGFTDALVPELTNSNLKLISLNLDGTSLENDDSILSFLDSFPSLNYLSFAETYISGEMQKLCVRRVVIPSIMNADPSIQLLGLKILFSTTQVSDRDRYLQCSDCVDELE
jgi:hypothetical protein